MTHERIIPQWIIFVFSLSLTLLIYAAFVIVLCGGALWASEAMAEDTVVMNGVMYQDSFIADAHPDPDPVQELVTVWSYGHENSRTVIHYNREGDYFFLPNSIKVITPHHQGEFGYYGEYEVLLEAGTKIYIGNENLEDK